jgi:DNA-binding GntR family transcriptional regulator
VALPQPAPTVPEAGPTHRTGRAYESIRDAILENRIKPGSHLSENQLARSLGMSRTPIREALKVLQGEGLVEIVENAGIFVRQITLKEVFDLFEVRAVLECAALPSALEKITDEEIDAIRARWAAQEEKARSGAEIDLNGLMAMDLDLHFFVVDRCGNEFLKTVLAGIRMRIKRYQLMSARALDNAHSVIEQHLEILDYMKRRDVEALARVLKRHIRQAAENVIRHPQWPV